MGKYRGNDMSDTRNAPPEGTCNYSANCLSRVACGKKFSKSLQINPKPIGKNIKI